MHYENTGTATVTDIGMTMIKTIYITSKAAASRAVLTDADGKKMVIGAPVNDTSQIVMPGSDMHVFNMKAPVAAVITGDADTFLRIDD